MKKPKLAAVTMQQQLDAGINAFAVQLLAESHADRPEQWGDQTLCLLGRAHNGTTVYILISTQQPELPQFEWWPE
jgi:hypothetical protein